MRRTVEDSNRRRERQIKYNIEHGIMPRAAKRNSSQPSSLLEGVGDKDMVSDRVVTYEVPIQGVGLVADSGAHYGVGTDIDALIDQARTDMERAAKSLDFMAAARYRDRMYELQQIKEEQLKNSYQ
jgi:excinuclease ABC subunit B